MKNVEFKLREPFLQEFSPSVMVRNDEFCLDPLTGRIPFLIPHFTFLIDGYLHSIPEDDLTSAPTSSPFWLHSCLPRSS